HCLDVPPPCRVDADRRADVDLVVVLKALRPHVAPPLDVLRLPVLERALQALVAGEVDVVRDLLGRDHRCLAVKDTKGTEDTKGGASVTSVTSVSSVSAREFSCALP